MLTTGSSSSDRARRWEKPRLFASRERIGPETLRQWAEKGLIEVRRLAPRTGVRVRYREDDE